MEAGAVYESISMESPDGDASPGVQPGKTQLQQDVDRFLAEKDAPNTVRGYRSQLETWTEWLVREHDIERVEDLDSSIMADYARELAGRVRAGDISGATAHTYFDYLSAFLHWCVGWEKIERNPARANIALNALPEDHGPGEQQFWTPEAREQLLHHVSEAAHDALESDAEERTRVFRDRAIAVVLALTGARGAEVFADPNDDHRNGLRWADVNLDRRVATVLGKSRETESIPLPTRVMRALAQLHRVQSPPSDEWPVFPTRHRPTLAALKDSEAPPSITVAGAREVIEGLSEAADLTIDGEYLKPHGGRRGIGGTLYRENAAFAQKLLRHQSLETTNETYEDIQTGEVADVVDDILD